MTIKPAEITASLRRMADVETSVLYSQRTTLIGAADEIERLQAENAALRQQLEGNGTTLYAVIADIRQKSGVGVKPMLSELADAIADRIAEARNKALDDAAASVEAVAHEGLHASMWRNKFDQVAETIRLMKVDTP